MLSLTSMRRCTSPSQSADACCPTASGVPAHTQSVSHVGGLAGDCAAFHASSIDTGYTLANPASTSAALEPGGTRPWSWATDDHP
jgi:hypothetical protein